MSPVSKELLLTSSISPIALAALRIGGGALLFALCSVVLPVSVAPREKIAREDYWKIFLASVLMISANQGLFIMGIGMTSPIDSSVMSSTTPMLTMLLAAIVLGYPITRLKVAGVAIGMAGVIWLAISGGEGAEGASNAVVGDAMCFAAQVCAALYYVKFSGLIKRYSPFTLMKWMFWMSALTFVPCCAPALTDVDFVGLSVANWLEIGFIIVFATCFAYLTLPYAQKLLRPTVVSIYNYLQPLCAAIVAVSLGLGSFGGDKILATVMIFAGVWFVNSDSRAQKNKLKFNYE